MREDQKIAKSLQKIVEKKGFSNVTVSVNNGIVQLAGTVDTWTDVVALGHDAGSMTHVRGVLNDITCKDAPEPSPKKVTPPTTDLPGTADVVIIGGGVIGCFIARELSQYNLDVILLEKEADVACGATKANNGQIHTGIGEKSGTLKKKLCAEAWPLYEKIAKDLGVTYKRNGLLVVLTEETLPKWIPSFLSRLILKCAIQPLVVKRGKDVGDTPQIIKKRELLQMEPNITDRAVSAVLMPGYGIICPYKLTIALAENALQNGVEIFLGTEVTDIVIENNSVQKVVTDKGEIKTHYVVNAAGVHADEVAAMAGAREYTIHPRKGGIILFDKDLQGYINHQVSELKFPQDVHTKGGGLLPTVDGNILWGPTAVEIPDKEDTSVTAEEIDVLVKKYHPTLPDFPLKVITYFAGVRAATYTEDFVIKAADVKGFIHAAGIQSPGLTAAPKIAEMVITLLQKEGLDLEETREFNPVRVLPSVFNELPPEEKKRLIEENPLYGNVVCRCEHVTEAEIVTIIHGLLPAVTVDAVKRRTRAGMGRCQGGFCGPRVAALLARELNIPPEKVTKKGEGSHLFVRKTKVVQ